jgi:hypothetical protein
MPDKPEKRFTESAGNLDDYAEQAEYLKDPIYRVHERGRRSEPRRHIYSGQLALQPWCGLTLAFDLALTAAEKWFLRELGIEY